MTPHLHLTTDQGGRVGVYLPQRPQSDAAPTVTVRDNAGTALVTSQATTLEGVSTTLSSAASAGARTLAVASGTGIDAGRDYEVGALDPEAQVEPTETVRVLSRSTNTLTLARPIIYAHASGAALFSTLATTDIAAAAISAAFRFGRAEFSWTDRAALAQVAVVRVDALARQSEGHHQRRYPRVALSEQDLFERYARLDLLVPDGTHLRATLRSAERAVLGWLDRYLPSARGRAVVGGDALLDAAAWQALAWMWTQNTMSEAGNPFAAPLAAALEDLLYVGVDTNQDGAVGQAIADNRMEFPRQ